MYQIPSKVKTDRNHVLTGKTGRERYSEKEGRIWMKFTQFNKQYRLQTETEHLNTKSINSGKIANGIGTDVRMYYIVSNDKNQNSL